MRINMRAMATPILEEVDNNLKVIDGKSVTQADFASAYKKLGKPNIGFSEMARLLADLASSKNLDIRVLKEKLIKAG